jgi:hypothetical protein
MGHDDRYFRRNEEGPNDLGDPTWGRWPTTANKVISIEGKSLEVLELIEQYQEGVKDSRE